MNRVRSCISVLILAFSLFACGPALKTKIECFPRMYEERPLSVLVLPPINESTAADAKEYYATTIAEPLSLTGYYVFPIEVITDILQNEGAYDTETLLNFPLEKFREFFGADAVMYVWIKKWDTAYYVIGGNVTVSVKALLRSTRTGETLWEYEGTYVHDTTVRSTGGGLAGLLVAAIATAVTTAATDYVPVARRANYFVLSTLPLGKYHPAHGKDKDFKILPPR